MSGYLGNEAEAVLLLKNRI